MSSSNNNNTADQSGTESARSPMNSTQSCQFQFIVNIVVAVDTNVLNNTKCCMWG